MVFRMTIMKNILVLVFAFFISFTLVNAQGKSQQKRSSNAEQNKIYSNNTNGVKEKSKKENIPNRKSIDQEEKKITIKQADEETEKRKEEFNREEKEVKNQKITGHAYGKNKKDLNGR